ncbi:MULTISPECIES: Cmx/CmrA family chloramphenicol efflux MFS transporter [Kitasatospora]|uniref:Putative drug resistance protein n=1 Tax=Kitasatospora setae (strain ATCC 33774 / DSM 43861 / JCM 3304 / KCC A-0304 / NBRC 14216 / KM-6054) TaxID=452652 RepID=E4N6X7_KITSK|nr:MULTISPECIES: Cmx/CmrA family chloramphenicol efflux MFS transporter [Kitasatospora]BAJ26958.1 putative drug resistance protein [Kitasatospora setae KM-6054]
MPFSLYLLALAVFAMGTSEFLPAGLLPELAAGLGVSVGTAGALASAFALGMVVGAPLMAVWARRWPRRAGLFGFVAVFAAAHAAGALTGSFHVLLATRVVAALANAGFLALAVATAAALVVPERRGRALGVLLSGTTAATVAGVPAGALLGQLLDWRAAFWAVAVLCVPAALGVLLGVPAGAGGAGAPALRVELAQLARPGLWSALLAAALVNAGTFGAFTFLAPVVTGPAGLGRGWVPVVLVLFGAGTFLGVNAAGRLADRHSRGLLLVGGPSLLLGWPALAAAAGRPAVLLPLVLLLGALAFAVGATLITRALYEGSGAPTLSGGYATAALNLGAVAGPLLAAATLRSPTGPFRSAALLVAAALLVCAVGRALSRARR